MTAQLTDNLKYMGETMCLTTLPLSAYWSIARLHQELAEGDNHEFSDMGTWCWRRHTASWQIEQDHLYLVAINAAYKDGAKVMLEDFFPGYPERVFAHWFSGELCCPCGELLEYVHAGFASRYAEELLIQVERGVVKGQQLRDNRVQGEV